MTAEFQRAMRRMLEIQQDFQEIISKWQMMLSNIPQCIEFRMFDGSVYVIPNFARMLEQMTTWSVAPDPNTLVMRGEQGEIYAGHVYGSQFSAIDTPNADQPYINTAIRINPEGIESRWQQADMSGRRFILNPHRVASSTPHREANTPWELSKDSVHGEDGWRLDRSGVNGVNWNVSTDGVKSTDPTKQWELSNDGVAFNGRQLKTQTLFISNTGTLYPFLVHNENSDFLHFEMRRQNGNLRASGLHPRVLRKFLQTTQFTFNDKIIHSITLCHPNHENVTLTSSMVWNGAKDDLLDTIVEEPEIIEPTDPDYDTTELLRFNALFPAYEWTRRNYFTIDREADDPVPSVKLLPINGAKLIILYSTATE